MAAPVRHGEGRLPPRASVVLHCSACGAATRPHEGHHRRCTACGHVDYQNPAPAVSAILVRDGRVLLSKRRRAPHAGAWDLPGGFVDPGEAGTEAIAREVREETGMTVTHAAVLDILSGDYDGEPTFTVIYRIEAEGEPVADDDSEELRWWPLDDRPTLCWPHEERVLARLGKEAPPSSTAANTGL